MIKSYIYVAWTIDPSQVGECNKPWLVGQHRGFPFVGRSSSSDSAIVEIVIWLRSPMLVAWIFHALPPAPRGLVTL